MYKKANSNDSNTRSKAADDVLDNIDKREKTFDKEVSILKNSEKQFKKGDSHINDIKNDDYAKAYRNVLSKEKDLFELVKQDGVTQSQVDEKNNALNKAQENFKKKFQAYAKAMNTVNKEKQDVDHLIS